jgi:V/A-type H+-transporting ATPase subunit C
VSDYDYLNARVRGMGTSLLSRAFYDQTLEVPTLELFVDTLLLTSYGEGLRDALAAVGGAASPGACAAVEAALARGAQAAIAKVRAIAPPGPLRMITIQLNRWDVTNVLALLRGKLSGASPKDVLESVLPVGEFNATQLGELAGEMDVPSLAEALTTWNYTFAFILRRAILEYSAETDLPTLEHTLERAFFNWALVQLRADDRNEALVRDSIRRQIDLANVRALLDIVKEREKGREPSPIEPIGRGKLSPRTLKELADSDSLDTAFATLEETYFAPAIEKGILSFGQTRSLASMERFLEAMIVDHGCRIFRQDMLGIAVPLGFLWRKYSELVNLRILARGKAYRMPASAIREEMVLV